MHSTRLSFRKHSYRNAKRTTLTYQDGHEYFCPTTSCNTHVPMSVLMLKPLLEASRAFVSLSKVLCVDCQVEYRDYRHPPDIHSPFYVSRMGVMEVCLHLVVNSIYGAFLSFTIARSMLNAHCLLLIAQ